MLSGPETTGSWYGGGGREGGGTGPSLEELRLTKFGCNLRTSRVASCLGWTGAVFRWENEIINWNKPTNQLIFQCSRSGCSLLSHIRLWLWPARQIFCSSRRRWNPDIYCLVQLLGSSDNETPSRGQRWSFEADQNCLHCLLWHKNKYSPSHHHNECCDNR